MINWYKKWFLFFIGVPAIVWQLLFCYVPLLSVIVLSFSGTNFFDNFTLFFAWPYACVITRSLFLAFLNATLCMLVAYPLAYFLIFCAGRLKNVLLFLVILPFWTNFLVHMYAWMFVLDKHGIINSALRYLHIIDSPIHFLNTFPAVVLMMVYFYVPFMTLPLYATLERFDQRLFETSLDLGATWWDTIRYVVFPLSMPGLRTGFFLVFIPSFGEFVIPEFMGGNMHMYVGSLVSDFIIGSQTIGYGAAFTVMSSLSLFIVAVILYKLMGTYIVSGVE